MKYTDIATHTFSDQNRPRILETIRTVAQGKKNPVKMDTYISALEEAENRDVHIPDDFTSDMFKHRRLRTPVFTDFSGDAVVIGREEDLPVLERDQILQGVREDLQRLIPWRKGPYRILGMELDAEWQSHLKWNRFAPFVPPLENAVIGDIGSNSGYYLFKMAAHNPALVMGFDPVLKFRVQFEYLQNLARVPTLHYNLLGWDALRYFPDFFDVIFNMGIIYHHKSPLEVLEYSYNALTPGGTLVLETMGLDSPEEVVLSPSRRYCGVPGIWFVPSEKSLINWLRRIHFTDIRVVYNARLGVEEQRSTSWAPYESLSDFLGKKNPDLTIEGYPAPNRIYVMAKKPGTLVPRPSALS